jgi:hypothetical protein
VDVTEAQRVLGVPAGVTDDELRAAYHRQLHDNHPDVARAGETDAGDATRRIIEAYRLLQALPPPLRAAPPVRRSGPQRIVIHRQVRRGTVVRTEGDTIVVGLPGAETFNALLEVGHTLGEVAYVDADVGLLETVVAFKDGPVCSVVFSLQGRSNGSTEALVTVEALGGEQEPPTRLVAVLVADRLRAIVA